MKSKKSGHKSTHESGLQEHGFHNQQFDRHGPPSAHHGIVGVKNGGPSGLPLVVKNTGGSQARNRTTTTGE